MHSEFLGNTMVQETNSLIKVSKAKVSAVAKTTDSIQDRSGFSNKKDVIIVEDEVWGMPRSESNVMSFTCHKTGIHEDAQRPMEVGHSQ